MRIIRFEAARVHGYLNFDISFFPGITYLTGINGSGKTTIVSGVSALISPSLSTLAKTSYVSMAVTLEDRRRKMVITSRKEEDVLILGIHGEDDALEVPMIQSQELGHARVEERETEYYREQEARWASHPVLKRLKALPTPMFLGLERRSGWFFEREERFMPATVRRRMHNVFSSSLSRSLAEASALAEHQHNAVQARQRELTESLRRELILNTLRYKPEYPRNAAPPQLNEDTVGRVKATLREVGLSERDIDHNLDPLVDRLREISQYMPFSEDIYKVMQAKDGQKTKAYIEWFTNRGQFDRLTQIMREVEHYAARAQEANKPLDTYLGTVNRFLRDSKKEVAFDRTGNLTVRIKGGAVRPIAALSSGESQLVVILTHLAFNPAARAANVFIVDEPELSLHLRWQELFVESVQAVNPGLQVILATHSPAIILDDIAHCVDLSPSARR